MFNNLFSVIIEHFRSPRIFLLGVIFGFGLCVIFGMKLAHDGYYGAFERVQGPYQIDNHFLLSASQISKVIRSGCDTENVLVLIGGSSIMNGVGQPIRYLWSKKLKENLGDGYCVYNLAGPAGALNGFASTTMDILGAEYKEVFLVSDMSEGVVHYPPDGVMSQKHYFWDAYYKNMLSTDLMNYVSEKKALFQGNRKKLSESARNDLEKIELSMLLDGLFYYNDLWTYIDYNYFTSYYTQNAGAWQWTPRKIWPDYDFEVDFEVLKSLTHYTQPVDSEAFKATLSKYSNLSAYYDDSSGGEEVSSRYLSKLARQIEDNYLTRVSSNIILAYIGVSPYYFDHMAEDVQKGYEDIYKSKAELFESYGYSVVRPRFEAEDFIDPFHLNTLGGWKLADEVADRILTLDND